MLILTRRVGEAIWIDETTRVVIKGVQGKTVRVGIQAPREVPVYREELLDENSSKKEERLRTK